VLTGHGAEEAELARQIASACGVETVDLTTGTPLGVLAVLLREAAVTVCNDTGVSHVAAAVGAPSVVIFRTTDPKRWAPADARRHRVVRDGDGAVEMAIDEALRLIAGEGIRAA
jgi:ADP-heptose:LPS heptosyltransferase